MLKRVGRQADARRRFSVAFNLRRIMTVRPENLVRGTSGITNACQVSQVAGCQPGLLGTQIGQSKPLLQGVDAQHRCQLKRYPFRTGHCRIRCDQRNQLVPQHQTLCLIKYDLLTFELGIESDVKSILLNATKECNLFASMRQTGKY